MELKKVYKHGTILILSNYISEYSTGIDLTPPKPYEKDKEEVLSDMKVYQACNNDLKEAEKDLKERGFKPV